MLCIIYHQGNENQNNKYISSHTIEIVTIKKKTTNTHVNTKENYPHLLLAQILISSKLLETMWTVLNKLRIRLIYDSAVPLPHIYPKDPKTLLRNDYCKPMLIAIVTAIFDIHNIKSGNNPVSLKLYSKMTIVLYSKMTIVLL